MMRFEHHLVVPVPREMLHAWHMRAGAFERLCPPWETMRSIHADPIEDGAQRIFAIKKGGVWVRWVADHQEVIHPERFTDILIKGPFKRWRHTHRFDCLDSNRSKLVDAGEYELPMGLFGRAMGGRSVRLDVERMFNYRHRVTLDDLKAHGRFSGRRPMCVAVSGSSGLVGEQLVAFLRTGGHQVLRLVRGGETRAEDEIRWSVDGGVVDVEVLERVDAVVHLAGASIAQRWTEQAKRSIRDSRVLGTRAIVDAIARLSQRPRVFVSASAVGFYGDTGRTVVDEEAPAGEGFLADVCKAWEIESKRAEDAGCRSVQLRLGVVMDPRGGALQKLLPITKLGFGGPVGGGAQLVSWVGLDDVLGACLSALQDDSLVGPINVTGPAPASQATLARALGRVLSRPSFAPAPALAIEALYGEMGRATVLGSTGARPARLEKLGFAFVHPP